MPKEESKKLAEFFTAMQTEGLIKYHGKTKYEPGGAPGAKADNPDYEYYPGYGNHKTLHVETMPAARCVPVTLARLRQHAAEHIGSYNFRSNPPNFGDDLLKYDNEAAFIEYIDSVPDPLDADEEAAAADPGWRAQVEARLARMEDKLKLPPLPTA